MELKIRLGLIWQKLKREWKTFALQVSLFIASAWELASSMGADLPSLFSFLPETWRPWFLFGFAAAMLLVRKYSPTTVVVQAPEAPVEPEATVKEEK